ncbi:MAG: hypothetical protein KME57_22535 [Scytonema hyalinum WJT4-NPBG1]|jgi:hypothetical protein|nr:hypothetical protein [Scytonema hyalinum WJT4-NPBG1]
MSNSVSQRLHCSPVERSSFVSSGWSAPMSPHESNLIATGITSIDNVCLLSVPPRVRNVESPHSLNNPWLLLVGGVFIISRLLQSRR